uniref:PDZ domain-containing protein n=1 Tax=Acrobeloides nanus TaxID=290746 RepID=A0A914CYF3_9BILA
MLKVSMACTSTIPHHQFDKISSTSNGYRKSLVLNGTPNHYPTNNNGSISERTVPPQKNGYYNGHSMTNGSANPTTEFPPTSNGIMHGTISRRNLVNGMTQSAREPVYKASPRIVQPMANGKLNGTPAQNGSPRNSIASYTSYTSTNGSSNHPTNGDYSNGSPKRKSPTRQQSASPTSIAGEDSIVQVRMSPDSQGRYGFNVSGGYDRGHPVIVSRVIAGSPADRCHPRLNEGDQVLKINGQDISQWDYDRVVAYIRSVRTNSILGEISLLIKPNVYRCGEFDESESLQNSIPETPHVAETVPRSDKLAQSLLLQKEAIESGKILRQFEQLY